MKSEFDSGFFVSLMISAVVFFFVTIHYSGKISELNDEISLQEMTLDNARECISSLSKDRDELRMTIINTESAIDEVTGPAFGYFPEYDELVSSHENSADAVNGYDGFGVIFTECEDFR
ncbi:MAG: hypothetical protein HGA33_03265 [Candidatus Moranbacteria bacterium]|nr:hypothetical protein [Candidatus Moranbacteria bacterium]